MYTYGQTQDMEEQTGKKITFTTKEIKTKSSFVLLIEKIYLLGHLSGSVVRCLTSAQVMISQMVGSSPALDSGLTAWSPEPASDSESPSLSAPPLLTLSLSLSLKNKH